jgi:hypothetical protein
MTSLRPALIGLVAGALAYAGMSGFLNPSSGQEADIGDTVAQEVSPTVSPVTKTGTGDKTGDKSGDKKLSPVLSPTAVVNLSPLRVTAIFNAFPTHATPTPTPRSPRVATPTPTPTPSPSPTPTPAPTQTPTPSLTPTPGPVLVVINEVGWSGTASGSSDEWFELYNAGDEPVDLSGWALFEGETLVIPLSGMIASGGYYLVERTDDTTISDITADKTGAFGGSGFRNPDSNPDTPNGEHLILRDAGGGVVDEVPCLSGWFAGTASPDYAHGGVTSGEHRPVQLGYPLTRKRLRP